MLVKYTVPDPVQRRSVCQSPSSQSRECADSALAGSTFRSSHSEFQIDFPLHEVDGP
jgi:hypothetical protein